MYFSNEADFAFLKRHAEDTFKADRRGKFLSLEQDCIRLAQTFEYYLIVSAGERVQIEAVAVKTDGEYFAFCVTFGERAPELRSVTGYFSGVDGAQFCDTLATVQDEYLGNRTYKVAA